MSSPPATLEIAENAEAKFARAL